MWMMRASIRLERFDPGSFDPEIFAPRLFDPDLFNAGRFRRIHFKASRETRNGPRAFEAKIASHCRTVRLSKSAVA
jgi:hypothetical protein